MQNHMQQKEGQGLTRRSFLSLAALAGTGAALTGCAPGGKQAASTAPDPDAATEQEPWMKAPEPVADSDIDETKEADIVIVGGGIAGSSAAASCAEQGLSVILIDKNEYPRTTGMDYGCINPSIQAEYGIPPIDAYEVMREWMKITSPRARPDLILQYLENSGEAIDWLCGLLAKKDVKPVIIPRSKGDYFPNIGVTVEFRRADGHPVSGFAGDRDVIEALTDHLTAHGGTFVYQCQASQLVKDGDTVTGVIAYDADGRCIKYVGTKGVVLAAGGFGGDAELLKAWGPPVEYDSFDPLHFIHTAEGTGDGHKMGLWAGGQLQPGPQPMMWLAATAPYFYLHVNGLGERYTNEDTASVNVAVGQLCQPNCIAWSIWDSKWTTEIPASLEYGGGMNWDQDFRVDGEPWSLETEQALMDANEKMGLLFKADTLEELAQAIDVPKDTFLKTVERYNELVKHGKDVDFGKRPELLTSISEPPYYALAMQAALSVTVGGLNVNLDHQVLAADSREPIPGLYAIGNVAGGYYGVDYEQSAIPGCSLGRAVTGGWLLGKRFSA